MVFFFLFTHLQIFWKTDLHAFLRIDKYGFD